MQITQLDEISIDESYADIRYLYAEYNQIKTLTVLEGSRFMDKFTHLGLKHNNIKTVRDELFTILILIVGI